MRTVVRAALGEALSALRSEGVALPENPEIGLERPRLAEHGDLATNVAMTLSKAAAMKPRDLAEKIVAALNRRAAEGDSPIAAAELAGPGFINLKLRVGAFHAVIDEVLTKGAAFGQHPPRDTDARVLVEFVSANPTGPLHLGHARGTVVGDALVRVLRAAGHAVSTEYYINDRGAQVLKLGLSVRARATGGAVPDGGYGGAYVTEVAEWMKQHHPERLASDDDLALARVAGERIMEGVRETLGKLGVSFDRFVSERALTEEEGKLELAMARLEAAGLIESRDGALFFKSKGKGDDKDRVLKKSAEHGGDWTYFATDIAYHVDKHTRGFTHLIDVWGADHHGYVPRVRGALESLGYPKGAFEVLLLQLVKLIKDGQEVKFSKRAGNFVTIEDVLEEIDEATGVPGAGRDALRLLMLIRSHDSSLELDIDVAKKQSNDNPVFYAQMTHARMCSIARRVEESAEMAEARARGVLSVPARFDAALAARLTLPEELDILALCDSFPGLVVEAAASRAPHRVAFFVLELAQAFASYFTRMQKVHNEPILPQKSYRDAHPDWVATWDWEKTRARLLWLSAVRQVYANALALLGISAPERMHRDAPDEAPEAAPELAPEAPQG
ncbi:MAG: arginine--tRNA ligase [Myxococcales bacterium]|nr:arginine--tRNA ligase [Myxococcales bacterium]